MYLTQKQKSILDFVKEYLAEHGMAPTYAEIADAFGYRSKGVVHKHITNLEHKGAIKKEWNRARCLQEGDPTSRARTYEVPLLGRVVVGEPIEASEHREEIAVSPDMVGRGDHYALQVAGDTLNAENIQDGDYMIAQSRNDAQNGELVIALIKNRAAVLKKFYHEGERVRLESVQGCMAPITLAAEHVRIRGKVMGVIRKY